MVEPPMQPPVGDDAATVGGRRISVRRVLMIGAWFGVVVGLLELSMIPALKPLRDPSPGFFRLNRHSVWMIPTVDFTLFVSLAVVVGAARGLMPRVRDRGILFAFTFLGVLILLVSYPRLFLIANLCLAAGIAYRVSGRIERNLERFVRFAGVTLAPLTAVAALTAGLSFHHEVWKPRRGAASVPVARPDQPNVMLLVLDTVRADHLSLYGYERSTSPNLERYASKGIRFDQARSTAPWTLPSHAGMMTGRWPHQLSCNINNPLDEAFPTVAEFLRDRGYATGGFVANLNYAGAETGLGRGFDLYADHDVSPVGALRTTALGKQVVWPIVRFNDAMVHRDALIYRKDAREINRQTLEWIDRMPSDRPFFAFLNYYDAHDPYLPPVDHVHRFGKRPETRADLRLFHEWFLRNKQKIGERERLLAIDAYDDCIAYLDARVGELLDELRTRGILDKTLVIITADHGEHFGSHGLYGHASSLYSEETRVPLLVLPPKAMSIRTGVVVDQPVSLRELPATIADFVAPRAGGVAPFPGESLADFWSSEPDADDEEPRRVLSGIDQPVPAAPNHGRSPVFRGEMSSIMVDDYLYIKNGDGVEELYDVSKDPSESRNLVGSREAEAALTRCRDRLRLVLAEEPPNRSNSQSD